MSYHSVGALNVCWRVQMMALLLTALTLQHAFACEAWCRDNPCEELTGDPTKECSNCVYPMLCRPGQQGFVRSRDSSPAQRPRPRRSVVRVSGCPVIEVPSSSAGVAAMARSLHDGGRPTLLRGLVGADVLRAAAAASRSEDTGSTPESRNNPAHAMCSKRWGDHERWADGVPAASLGASFVAACAWAKARLYGDTPLWRALWGYGGRSAPEGQAVVSRNRAVGFHQHGPTLNALLSGGSRHWFLFDLAESLGGHGRGWEVLPLLRRLALDEAREPSADDWLPSALSEFGEVDASAAYECTQEVGDVMFVPNGVHHAIVERGTEESRAVFFIAENTVWEHGKIERNDEFLNCDSG
jgi:hypothetical protein